MSVWFLSPAPGWALLLGAYCSAGPLQLSLILINSSALLLGITQCGGEILARAKCKHFPDELWRCQANIVTTKR